jgi:hypothetical protein
MKKRKKGISLIVLIICIVIIIILEAAIIENINTNGTFTLTSKTAVMSDFQSLDDELSIYISQKVMESKGKICEKDINATTKEEVISIIPLLKGTAYENYITISNGKIVVDESMPHREWAIAVVGDNK